MGNTCVRYESQVIEIGLYKVKTKKPLARGGYGFVYLVQDMQKRYYALKIMGRANAQAKRAFEQEVEVMKIIGEHPNIIKIYATQKKQEAGFILMELGKSTLWQMLSKTQNNHITQSQIVYILRQITSGLRHIHSKGYAHRDIKTQNILIMDDGSVRICDFGSCTAQFMNTDDIKTSKVSYIEREIGKNTTYMFRPPQLVNFDLGYRIDQQMDMWMLGCIAYILAFYKSPFKGLQPPKSLIKQISLPVSEDVSQSLRTFILMLLKPDPKQRATSQQALAYLNNSFNLSRKQTIR